jgi:hypothetical protein
MKHLKKLFIYIISFNPLRISELIQYYKRYVILPRLFGYYQSPSIRYRLSIIYEFLKYRYYSKKNIDYVLNCVPRSFFKYYLSHKTRHFEYGKNCIDKQLFYLLLDNHSFPTPINLGTIKNGAVTNLKSEEISLDTDETNSKVFLKKIKGSVGVGAKIIYRKDINISKYDGYLIQEVCQNHPKIKELAPNNAFNTIRIHTYFSVNNSTATILGAHIKLAAMGDITDNISTGGIGVEIDIETGRLAEFGFSEYNMGQIVNYPGSQIKFKDFEIPYWNDLIVQVTNASKLMKTNLIGWDIGITEKGVVFIEGNSGSDIFIPQAFYKPFFDSSLIQDFIVDPNYHQWVKNFHEKLTK